MATERATCMCGHPVDVHASRDPGWRVGDLVEKFGACPFCGCKGQIMDALELAVLIEQGAPDHTETKGTT